MQKEEKKKQRQENDRFVLIPSCDKAIKKDVLTKRLQDELEQFFNATTLGSGKMLTFKGWHPANEALRRLKKGAAQAKKKS